MLCLTNMQFDAPGQLRTIICVPPLTGALIFQQVHSERTAGHAPMTTPQPLLKLVCFTCVHFALFQKFTRTLQRAHSQCLLQKSGVLFGTSLLNAQLVTEGMGEGMGERRNDCSKAQTTAKEETSSTGLLRVGYSHSS